MIFQLHFRSREGAYSYLVAASDSNEAILVDPVDEHLEDYARLLARYDYRLRYTFETGSVVGAGETAARLGSSWGCARVVPCDAFCDGRVIRVGHLDELRIEGLGVEVVGRPGRRQDRVSFRVHDRAFTGVASIASEPELLALPADTLIYRSREVRGTHFSLLGLEAAPLPRVRGSGRGEIGAFDPVGRRGSVVGLRH